MKKNKPQKKENKVQVSFKTRYLYNKFFKGSVICSDFLKNHNFDVVHLETSKSRINAILPKEIAKNIDLNQELYFQIEVIESSKIQMVHAEQTVNAPCIIVSKIKLEEEINNDEIVKDFAEMGLSSNFYKNFSKGLEELSKKDSYKYFDINVIDELVHEYAQNKLKIIEKNKEFYERNADLVYDSNHIEIFLNYISDYYENLTYEFEERDVEYENIYDLIQVIDNGLKLKHIFRICVSQNLCAKLIDLNSNETMYFDIELLNVFELLHKKIKNYYHIKEKEKDYANFFKEFFRECFISSTNIADDVQSSLDEYSLSIDNFFADPKYLSKMDKTEYISSYSLKNEDISKYTQNKDQVIPKFNSDILKDKTTRTLIRKIETTFVVVSKYLQAFEYSLLKYATFGTLDNEQAVPDDTWFSRQSINFYLNEFSIKMLENPMVSTTSKDIFASSKSELIKRINYLHHRLPVLLVRDIFYAENLSKSQDKLEEYLKELLSYQKFILFSFKNLFPSIDIKEIALPKEKADETNETNSSIEYNTLFCNYYFQLLFSLLKVENKLYRLLFTINKKADQEHSYSDHKIEFMQTFTIGEYIKRLETLPKGKNNNFLLISAYDLNIDFEKFFMKAKELKNIRNYWVHKALLTFDLFNDKSKKMLTNKINKMKLAINQTENFSKDLEKILKHI